MNKKIMKGFIPRGLMKKRIESTDNRVKQGKNIDPFQSSAGTANNEASLFTGQGGAEGDLKRGSEKKRDRRKDLSNEFFLADFDLEQ